MIDQHTVELLLALFASVLMFTNPMMTIAALRQPARVVAFIATMIVMFCVALLLAMLRLAVKP